MRCPIREWQCHRHWNFSRYREVRVLPRNRLKPGDARFAPRCDTPYIHTASSCVFAIDGHRHPFALARIYKDIKIHYACRGWEGLT